MSIKLGMSDCGREISLLIKWWYNFLYYDLKELGPACQNYTREPLTYCENNNSDPA